MFEFNRNPSRRELSWFGALLPVFFVAVGLIAVFQFGASWRTAAVIAGSGVVLAAVFFAVSGIRRAIYLAWMFAAAPIGWAISHLVLAVVYYAVITPIGLIMRLAGRDAMGRRQAAASYWVNSRQDSSPAGYFRQF